MDGEVDNNGAADSKPPSRGASRSAAPRTNRNNPYVISPTTLTPSMSAQLANPTTSGANSPGAVSYGAYNSGTSLTENPEDTSEIAALFPTFEPDVVAVGPAVHHHHHHHHHSSHHGSRTPSPGISSFSKSTGNTHNPYGGMQVLSSSQGCTHPTVGSASAAAAAGAGGPNNSTGGHLFPHDSALVGASGGVAYVYGPHASSQGSSRNYGHGPGNGNSNSTSQNPLMFNFNASNTGVSGMYGQDGDLLKGQVGMAACGSGPATYPHSSQGNTHGVGGCSATPGTSQSDIRVVTTEIHEAPNLTVSVKQRVRTPSQSMGATPPGLCQGQEPASLSIHDVAAAVLPQSQQQAYYAQQQHQGGVGGGGTYSGGQDPNGMIAGASGEMYDGYDGRPRMPPSQARLREAASGSSGLTTPRSASSWRSGGAQQVQPRDTHHQQQEHMQQCQDNSSAGPYNSNNHRDGSSAVPTMQYSAAYGSQAQPLCMGGSGSNSPTYSSAPQIGAAHEGSISTASRYTAASAQGPPQQHRHQHQSCPYPLQQQQFRAPSDRSHGSRSQNTSQGQHTPRAHSDARHSRAVSPGHIRRSPGNASLSCQRPRGTPSSHSLRSKRSPGKKVKARLRGGADGDAVASMRADRSKPITGFVTVKGKLEGFRYATSLDLEKDLPIGTKVVVEGDRGELVGVVLRHYTVAEMVRDCERLEAVAPQIAKKLAGYEQNASRRISSSGSGGVSAAAAAAASGPVADAGGTQHGDSSTSLHSSALFEDSANSSTAAQPPPGDMCKDGTQVYKPVTAVASDTDQASAKTLRAPVTLLTPRLNPRSDSTEGVRSSAGSMHTLTEDGGSTNFVDLGSSNVGEGQRGSSDVDPVCEDVVREKLGTVVFAYRDWPWVIQVATREEEELLREQREMESKAFTTAASIVSLYVRRSKSEKGSDMSTGHESKSFSTTGSGKGKKDKGSGRRSESDDDVAFDSSAPPETHPSEIHLVDVEYQLSRQKLTLYVSRPSPDIFVDFRRMQRKLYRAFRCRIWMAYMDEISADNDSPEHVERMAKLFAQKQVQQRRLKEARDAAASIDA